MIRDVRLDDAKEMTDIYNYYIKNTSITFEEVEVDSIEIGFIEVAHYREVGYKFNTWLDTGAWQLLLPQTENR